MLPGPSGQVYMPRRERLRDSIAHLGGHWACSSILTGTAVLSTALVLSHRCRSSFPILLRGEKMASIGTRRLLAEPVICLILFLVVQIRQLTRIHDGDGAHASCNWH